MLDLPPVIGSAKHKSDAIRQEPSRRLPLGWIVRIEVLMDAEFVTVKVTDGIATITLGTEKRIYIDQGTSDALFATLTRCAGGPDIRVVIIAGAGPGQFVRHYSIPELIRFAESVRATGREWPEARFIDGPISVCESMPKPVIAAISGTCLAGAFELTLSCDLRIAEDGDYQIGFPEPNFGLCPGAGGTQRLARTIGTPAALMHILMGVPVSPREAERRGLVHETVSGHALDRAMEIARHLSSFTPESLAYIKRLVRSATETPLAQGLLLERRLFMKLCEGDAALSRMRAYDEQDTASPSRVT
jgi:enoyl-CoA hydratase/carnithine racemase